MISKKLLVWCCALGFTACLTGALAADDKNQSQGGSSSSSSSTAPAASATPPSSSSSSSNQTVAKPLSAKERKKKEEKFKKEVEPAYKKWLNEDVVYIITDEEKKAFKDLQTDEEREQFIEQFWLRRDPTPDTVENEFKEEHYRRIAYANEHYASGIPGWKTDRGRIYIMYGPPDENESHPAGGTYERPIEEGGGETSTYPFEDWRYRYIEGVGQNIVIEFVDPTETGEYHITIDPEEKDALKNIPGAGATLYELMGVTDQTSRANGMLGNLTPTGMPVSENQNEFTKLETLAKLYHPPAIKYKDLEAQVNSKITYNVLPVKVRADYIRMTDSTILTSVTVQIENKDLQFQQKESVAKAVVNMYARVSTMTGRIVNVWEDPVVVESPAGMLEQMSKRSSIYQHSVFLAPGTYKLNVVVKDVTGGNMNSLPMALVVPHFDDDKLASSSLILADMIETVPTKNVGGGQFVIGDSKVRPRVTGAFNRDEKLGVYIQLYNFTGDEKTHKPQGTIQYQIVKNGAKDPILDYTEDVKNVPGASAQQVTVEKLLPLKTLEPGLYTLKMKVTDALSNQVLTPTAGFTVN